MGDFGYVRFILKSLFRSVLSLASHPPKSLPSVSRPPEPSQPTSQCPLSVPSASLPSGQWVRMQHLHRAPHQNEAQPPSRGWADGQSAHVCRGPATCHLPPANSSSGSQGLTLLLLGLPATAPCTRPPHGQRGGPGVGILPAAPASGTRPPPRHPTHDTDAALPPGRPATSSFLPWNLSCKDGSFPLALPCLSMCLPRCATCGSPALRLGTERSIWVPPRPRGRAPRRLPEVKNCLFICTVIITR